MGSCSRVVLELQLRCVIQSCFLSIKMYLYLQNKVQCLQTFQPRCTDLLRKVWKLDRIAHLNYNSTTTLQLQLYPFRHALLGWGLKVVEETWWYLDVKCKINLQNLRFFVGLYWSIDAIFDITKTRKWMITLTLRCHSRYSIDKKIVLFCQIDKEWWCFRKHLDVSDIGKYQFFLCYAELQVVNE